MWTKRYFFLYICNAIIVTNITHAVRVSSLAKQFHHHLFVSMHNSYVQRCNILKYDPHTKDNRFTWAYTLIYKINRLIGQIQLTLPFLCQFRSTFPSFKASWTAVRSPPWLALQNRSFWIILYKLQYEIVLIHAPSALNLRSRSSAITRSIIGKWPFIESGLEFFTLAFTP